MQLCSFTMACFAMTPAFVHTPQLVSLRTFQPGPINFYRGPIRGSKSALRSPYAEPDVPWTLMGRTVHLGADRETSDQPEEVVSQPDGEAELLEVCIKVFTSEWLTLCLLHNCSAFIPWPTGVQGSTATHSRQAHQRQQESGHQAFSEHTCRGSETGGAQSVVPQQQCARHGGQKARF